MASPEPEAGHGSMVAGPASQVEKKPVNQKTVKAKSKGKEIDESGTPAARKCT